MYKVLDLFAGAGGLSLGFEQTEKFEVIVAIEKNPSAQLTYKENHPNTEILDDILGVTNFNRFNEKYGQIDIIIGGPPCQGFSNANRQKFDLISHNNSLVKKYIEFVVKLKPKAFVVENVPMFKSKTHRFYISHDDNEDEFIGDVFEDKITLFNQEFLLGLEVLKSMGEKLNIEQYLIDDRLLKDVILLHKKAKNEKKLIDLIEKRGLKLVESINKAIANQNSDLEEYDQFIKNVLIMIRILAEGDIPKRGILEKIENFIHVQRYFYIILELKDNNIKYGSIELNADILEVSVKAITVFNYLMKKLGKEYIIAEGVLNAVCFGAPQTRKRFIAMGIREDLIRKEKVEVKLPEERFSKTRFRTVQDAFKDLENEVPQYEIGLNSIPLAEMELEQGSLLDSLRDADKLHNHVVTQTRDHILIRFRQLKQGQNFHDLDKSHITTYANPDRTQNSIYKRLDYSEASPTVTNARKSMWIHPTKNRAISIREAARLQTFPDSFVFKGTKDAQYQQVGNAVPPILSRAIAEQLLLTLKSIDV